MKTISNLELKIRILGHFVSQFLQREGYATVLGVTKKGVFLLNDFRQICFISQDPFPGPLTLNLENIVNLDLFFHIREAGQISGNQISFPGCQVVIQKDAMIWEPPLINTSEEDITPVINRGEKFVVFIKEDYQNGVFSDFFNSLLGPSTRYAWKTLLNIIPDGQGDGAINDKLTNLLGLGKGLTPSGDDFICGFLLAHYYLGKTLPAFEMRSDYLYRIITSAQKRTTALSAALIACAVEGQADERLMNLLYWLLSGVGDVGKIKEELLSYGNSSGMDTFAGMLAAILLPTNVI
jgi:hypothetical protein